MSDAVVLYLDLSTESRIQVELEGTTHINGNQTLKAISKALKQVGCWSGRSSDLKGKVRARGNSEDGSSSIEDLSTTVREFYSQGGSFVVNVKDLTGNLSACVQSLSGQVSDLRTELDNVKSRLDVVESEASEFRKVVFRYVIDEVHKKIQAKFGNKPEQQLWYDYLCEQFSKDQAWFKDRKLGFEELGLLSKGPNTHFEAGNNAAHRPEPATFSRIVGEGGESWRRLWAIVCS
ncbi:hypothetical protein GPECTOR_8g265 [Gonium pectorale]|uniref:Uncharacterized protein n=1 Tax=Gonium pectorale TaxID=33097 RepID=A0A150GSQ5_GONPE|nr:hypothetical protein GPECTOR_8g265 [Gonium pectorale]|eukprot:KXZ52885.1 hypothetical protein GPECTOR_8g265 [Gonium pectorale]